MPLFAIFHEEDNGEVWAEDARSGAIAMIVRAPNEQVAREKAIDTINMFRYDYRPNSTSQSIDSIQEIKVDGDDEIVWQQEHYG